MKIVDIDELSNIVSEERLNYLQSLTNIIAVCTSKLAIDKNNLIYLGNLYYSLYNILDVKEMFEERLEIFESVKSTFNFLIYLTSLIIISMLSRNLINFLRIINKSMYRDVNKVYRSTNSLETVRILRIFIYYLI